MALKKTHVLLHFYDFQQTFEKFSDKNWSFTDCSSKWIIEKLKIKTALTLDHHFQQFGSVLVLP